MNSILWALIRIVTCLSLLAVVVIFFSYRRPPSLGDQEPADQRRDSVASNADTADVAFARQRKDMVANQLANRDIINPRVLDAMGSVPRHRLVPAAWQDSAYSDRPLPIGHRQTISQPYIVALMTQLADPQPTDRALDVGTGSGYQAAILSALVEQVFSIEIVEPLAVQARKQLKHLGCDNVQVRHGDGYQGWPSQAPFDVIIVAAAPDHIPPVLIDQLAPGGRLVIPVGENYQTLKLVEKHPNGKIEKRDIIPVAFVPMTGKARQ